MAAELDHDVVDTLTLRFVGNERDGTTLHELRAAHVAEVLQGLVGLSSDFTRAGIFADGPANAEVLVRPAEHGSFLIEVVTIVQEHPDVIAAIAAATGIPSLSQIIWWSTRAARADVSNYERLDNDKVKIYWQDDTVNEVPLAVWEELNKRDRRRKKQLRQIMAPLSDPRVTSVEIQSPPASDVGESATPDVHTLTRVDYEAVRPDDEVQEQSEIFETEAQMSAIDFDDPTRWRVKTRDETRAAAVEDADFLSRVATGLPIRRSDIFRLKVREDSVEKNGRTRRTWTVLEVRRHKRGAHDDHA